MKEFITLNYLIKNLITLQSKVSFALEELFPQGTLSYYDIFYLEFIAKKKSLPSQTQIFFTDYFEKKVERKKLLNAGIIFLDEKGILTLTEKGSFILEKVPFPASVNNLFLLPERDEEFIIITEAIEYIDRKINCFS